MKRTVQLVEIVKNRVLVHRVEEHLMDSDLHCSNLVKRLGNSLSDGVGALSG